MEFGDSPPPFLRECHFGAGTERRTTTFFFFFSSCVRRRWFHGTKFHGTWSKQVFFSLFFLSLSPPFLSKFKIFGTKQKSLEGHEQWLGSPPLLFFFFFLLSLLFPPFFFHMDQREAEIKALGAG